MTSKTFIALALAGALCCCGDDSADVGEASSPTTTSTQGSTGEGVSVPAAFIVKQESIELSTFETEAASDTDLAAIAATLTLSAAGIVEDSDGASVLWAEGTHANGAIQTALRHCMADECVHALQTLDTAGASWQGLDGVTIPPRTLGRPVLTKDLSGQELDGRTVIAEQGLSTTNIDYVTDVPTYDYATREFVALNTFGDLFGTSLSSATESATRSGVFDVIQEHQYVREETLQATFEGLDGMDAVVWLTQGVRQETQGGWRASRTFGYTVNRGGFGESTLGRDQVRDLLNYNLAGGPGLIVLAGSATYSDGSEGQPDQGSAWQRMNDKDRVLVGVKGLADTEDILLGVQAFLDAYLSGDVSLGDALQLGSVPLANSGAALESNQFDVDLSRTWTANSKSVWDTFDFTPSTIQLRVPIAATPYCGAEGSPRQPKDEDQTQPFADVLFEGASFEGARVAELTGVSVEVNLRGTVTGFEVGDRVFLEVWGDFDESFKGFHAFGESVIKEVSTDEAGVVTVGFQGTAFATPYANEEGESCVLNDPKIQTTTSGLAAFVLTP